ncbi:MULTISPECIES: transcriptional regulator FeaR [Klebsiella]|uniref:Transcriptional activator feaR n=1 Tax=Klebsiella variicola TaxID=244366 RepID=A0ABD7PA83_KLEVA|nr:transcriptional regulator FeaR [Klebsiella variicola]MCD9672366.1 transcriptional regulator FeaR [Klebsiella variicola subsp. variicola]MCK6050116.1 transcriptional regulator FeaR [Klebsiella variicola]SXF96995.1 transcriptional activator feaR [Klebsiella variicola]
MLPEPCRTTDIIVWNTALRAVCGTFNAQSTQNHSLFIGDVVYRELAGIGFTLIRTNASRISGTPDNDNAHCYLISQIQGECWIHQGDAKCHLVPGEMMLLDNTEACEIFPEGLMTHASIHIPRAQLQFFLNESGSLFRKLNCRTLNGRMLHDLIRTSCHVYLHAFNEQHTEHEHVSLNDILLILLTSTWKQSNKEEDNFLDTHSWEHRWRLVKVFIDNNLCNPKLCPDMISERFAISRRQVHRLFSLYGSTPAKYIHKLRMEKIASSLRDPAFMDKNITELAYLWGFSDSTWFSHAFKKTYGISPSAWRKNDGRS